ncbi:MAG: hypothetical protein J6V44_16365 [Methanobrevibacter sp.]|nr:hypothetical protein [Methanobrevibacter sp.]MBO7692025.1 hypothetical protein [Methanobrevibacter sp.]
MKIFKDKNGTIYIVAGKGEEAPRVCIAKDDGKTARNMFGEKLDRFYYHYASVSGNTPYSSRTNCLISEEDNAYQYKLVKVKKIKNLGKDKSE